MFSKSLFKQSIKAHGTMWTIITVAVCFMLATVMLIAGGSNISESKNSFQDTIIEGELNSSIKQRSISYYVTSDGALKTFDITFSDSIKEIPTSEEAIALSQKVYLESIANGLSSSEATIKASLKVKEYTIKTSYLNAINSVNEYINKICVDKNIELNSDDYNEIYGLVMTVLNPMNEDGNYVQDEFYKKLNESTPRYDIQSLIDPNSNERIMYRKNYAAENSKIFLAGMLTDDNTITKVLEELSSFGVTYEKYQAMGFNDYNKLKNIANKSLIDFRANFAYRIENIKENETEESIINELSEDISKSLLSSLPKEVSDALEEIGKSDLYGVLVGSIFFKMAGLLLPIIYMIMTANSLIAGQVDSGSMAYILSTSTKRKTVVFTQAMYLILSLFAMFTCTSIVSVICLAIVDVETKLNFGKILLLNLGAFIVMFAMSGICFFTSCWFNRSKRSMAIGGGLNMFFLVATMLGLFGSEVIPSIVRMDALNAFNYVSIISLFDVINILQGGYTYVWKFIILIASGIILYIVGSKKFETKDLPL